MEACARCGHTARAVTESNVEIALAAMEALNRDGWEGLWRFADPEIEFYEPPEQPGATVFRGIDAARAGVERSWGQTWVSQHSVVERFVDLGERVFLLTVEHLRGRDGIEVTQPAGGILTFRAGKIVRFEAWWDRDTALRAAGLAE
jgi:ketosteroid isomerase-like protein